MFLPADEEASWSLPPSLGSLPSSAILQPGKTYSGIPKVAGQGWESQKRIRSTLITATASVHLPKLVSTDLTLKSDLVSINPIGRDGV